MISEYDKKLLTEAGREYILEAAINSKILKENLSVSEYKQICNNIKHLTYEEVIFVVVNEAIRDFESKFSKFIKYGIAGIAGLIGGLGGPPLAMFILYLYRKLTDTCERACFTKWPLSEERKICRYTCQLNAAKKMATNIRSEISKCSAFSNPEKCENKLQKEYIKWAKRVQVLTVKLNQARANLDEKNRKAAAERQSAESFAIKKYLKYRYLKEEEEGSDTVTPPKVDPKKEKMVRVVLYLGLWAVPIPFFNDVINYLIKKYDFSCASKCVAKKTISKELCYKQCSYLAAKYAVSILNKQLTKCAKAKDPIKCKNRIFSLLQDWKQREVERKIKLDSALRIDLKKRELLARKAK